MSATSPAARLVWQMVSPASDLRQSAVCGSATCDEQQQQHQGNHAQGSMQALKCYRDATACYTPSNSTCSRATCTLQCLLARQVHHGRPAHGQKLDPGLSHLLICQPTLGCLHAKSHLRIWLVLHGPLVTYAHSSRAPSVPAHNSIHESCAAGVWVPMLNPS